MKEFVQIHDEDYYCHTASQLAYKPHLHDYIELIYVFEGTAHASVDNKRYVLLPGDMLIVFSNCVHSYDEHESGLFLLLIFPPEIVPVFSAKLCGTRPVSARIENSEIPASARKIVEVIRENCHAGKTWMYGMLTALLSDVLPKMKLENDCFSHTTAAEVTRYCIKHYKESLSLKVLSEKMHISQSHLSHMFHDKLGVTFKKYINFLRVRDAQRLLSETDMSMSAVAEASGFTSVRAFNRIFVALVGTTPLKFRAFRMK